MGTTVSSLQILGATEDSIKNAMPNAVVGKWSARFFTACPVELTWISKKLVCTVLSVSLFDGDMLSMVLYVSGKRKACHVVNPEMGNMYKEMTPIRTANYGSNCPRPFYGKHE